MTEMLKGIAASDGVAVAKAYLLVQPDLSFETVTVEDTSAEERQTTFTDMMKVGLETLISE